MSDKARDLLVRGVAAAKAKDVDEARFFLEWVLRTESSLEQRADAFFWLGEISSDPEAKRGYLSEALACRPNHYQAQRSLAVLDGRLDPQDIINPDMLQPQLSNQQGETSAQRFVCQNCGGRLTYTPDGRSLTCEYCSRRKEVAETGLEQRQDINPYDFTIAMATAKGHFHPISTRTMECQACGAVFVLAPETVSLTCPYCAAVYVVDQTETRHLLPPQGIIPFTVTETRIRKLLLSWSNHHKLSVNTRLTPPRGLYFPAWVFSISGPLPWECSVPNDNNWEGSINENWKPLSGIELVAQDDIVVPASRTAPKKWVTRLHDYNLDALIPYEASYLADWPAESYQISVSDASLDARQLVLTKTRKALIEKIPFLYKNLHLDSKDLLVESFQLVLLPIWISSYHLAGKQHPIIVNGQTGNVWGSRPKRGVRNWLTSLFKDN